jgi:hypothetical protein
LLFNHLKKDHQPEFKQREEAIKKKNEKLKN